MSILAVPLLAIPILLRLMVLGYVEPNIEGRGLGGMFGKLTDGWLRTSPLTGHGIFGTGSGSGKKKWKKKYGALQKDYEALQAQNDASQTDIDTTQGQDYNWQTDPGYQFRFEEGQRALDRGAAARGGLLSGGYGRKAIRYGQGFASNEFTNVFNRIQSIAGMGQTANQHAGNAAQYGGQAMGQGALNYGAAGAYGSQMQGNAINNGINQLGQVDWGNIWRGNQQQQQPAARQPWEPN